MPVVSVLTALASSGLLSAEDDAPRKGWLLAQSAAAADLPTQPEPEVDTGEATPLPPAVLESARPSLVPHAGRAARVLDLLQRRARLVADRPGLGPPVWLFVASGALGALGGSMVGGFAPMLGLLSSSNGFSKFGGILALFMFVLGVVASAGHVALGIFGGVLLDKRIKARAENDAAIRDIDSKLNQEGIDPTESRL